MSSLWLTLLFYPFLNNVSSQTKPNSDLDRDNLKAQVLHLEQTVAYLQAQARNQEQKYTALVSSIESLGIRHDRTEQELASTQDVLMSTAANTVAIIQNVTRIGQDVSSLKIKMDQRDTIVAFQVSQTAEHTSNWTTLKFDTVTTNAGSCYNNNTGMFKTPIDGTYLFWANVDIYPPSDDYDHICVMKYGQCLSMGFSESAHDEGIDWVVSSVMTVTNLLQGQLIYFTIGSTESKIGGGGESSYGGALLDVAGN